MADMNQMPAPEPEKKRRNPAIYIIIIIALVLIDGYLYINNHKSQQQLTSQGQTINSDSINIANLDVRYHSVMDSLYSYRGQNATLDSMLKTKIMKLSEMERSLALATRTKKLDDARYQRNIDTLNAMVSDFKTQIADLENKNKILITKNDSLGKSIEVADSNNNLLSQQNTTLGTKLTKASLLVPVNIVSEGLKLKASGKEVESSNDKRIKKVRVSFDVPANNTIDGGEKTFYLVLKDPKGAILTDNSSGTFAMAESPTGEQQQYTTSKTINFNQQRAHVEIEWTNPGAFDQGNYVAEIYQDGYLTGKSILKLR